MKRLTLLPTLLLLCSMAFGQNGFQPVDRALVDGYVVLKTGQKLEGKIKIQNFEKMAETVIFFNELNIPMIYKPDDLSSYGLKMVFRNESGDLKREWRNFESKTASTPASKEEQISLVFVQNE